MTAEYLRETARMMREVAEAAEPGPWFWMSAPDGQAPMVASDRGLAVAETLDKPDLPDAKHIAAWHPTVALAVADWLDFKHGCHADDTGTLEQSARLDGSLWHALAVARAWRGDA